MKTMNDDRIKILFVDDEESNLKAFRANFRRDMDVHLANSGTEGLAVLEKEDIQIVISDQRMPGMTGSEFLSEVRRRHPGTMRMLLTGYADMDAVVQAVNEGGIYAYATKPWDANDLKLRIQQAHEVFALRSERKQLLDRYRQVFDASGDPIVIVDQKGKVLEANNATLELLGMDRDALVGSGMTSLMTDPGELVRALKRNRRGKDFLNVDITLKTPAGNIVDCLMTASYLPDGGQGKPVYQAIIKDISDRRQEEQRLRKLNSDLDKRVAVRTRQLLDALEDLGSFSYSVAHDLRSPLKNILALSQLLQDQPAVENDPDTSELSGRVHKGAERMIQLVDDLLRFSQTNTRELQRSQVDLRSMVEEVIEDQVPKERRQQVRCEIPAGSTMPADAPMVKVALQNLLSNALKFTRDEEVPDIVISADQEPEAFVLKVRDNGVGFDTDRAELVFGVFKRMHRNDEFEGTGVGLAIVQRIVQKHGGTAWAESAVGKGTTVYMRFPLEAPQEQALQFVKVA